MDGFIFYVGIVLLIYSISALLNYGLLSIKMICKVTEEVFNESELYKGMTYYDYQKLIIFFPIFNTVYFILFSVGIIWSILILPFKMIGKKDDENK